MRNQVTASFVLCAVLSGGVLLNARPFQQAVATPAPAATLANAADQQFTAGGVTLRYRDVGTGDAIVLIHGYTATLESMLGIANALPPEYRKVAFDVRGFGRSTKSGDPAQYGQLMADDVVHLMDSLKIERAHLVGHSMGALIAANVAARYPARVISASLLAGPFWAEPEMSNESRRWTTDLDSGAGLSNFIKWLLPFMNEQMAAATNAGMLKSNDIGSLTASMRELPKLVITGLKDGSRVLLVAGTGDPLFPTSAAFAKATPGSKFIEVAGANHISVLTHAETVKAMIEQLHR